MEEPGRVVVTGMGVVAPNGIGLDPFWDSLLAGRSGVGPITLFDASQYSVRIAGEVRGFNLRDYFPKAKPHHMSRQSQLALVACKMAVEHAGLNPEILGRLAPVRMVLGISSSAADIIEAAKVTILTQGPDHVRLLVGASQPSATAAELISYLGVRTSVTTVSNACPSGLDAIEIAARAIRSGQADLVLVGGADSPLNTTGLAGFAKTGVLSTSTDVPPEQVSRPFDRKRDGVVLAEGAGFLVLERLDCALARGAPCLLEIAGAASMMDAPGGESMDGLRLSMDLALQNASMYPDQVDYICANALSHPGMDAAEARGIRQLFGSAARRIPVSSIRGVMGHPLASAGIFQAVTCALALRHRVIPPTANLTEPDPACDLDHVRGAPRLSPAQTALINAHGVRGENTSLLVRQAS